MAEETVRLPDSRDVNRSWRRISTGKLSFLYSEEKILPNYLRSPTGSCHDVCKYGRKHESEDKPRVSPLRKRVNRSFSGTLSFDSPLRKKALTKSVLNPSSGSDDSAGGCDHAMSQVRNFSTRVCDVKKQNAERTRKKAVSFSDSRLGDSTKRKKTVSHSFKTIGVSRRRALEMVEHNKRVTALKLKSVAQTAAIALRRSTVNRKKINGGSKAAEPKKAVVSLRATVSSKRYPLSLKTKKESNSLSSVPLNKTRKLVDDKCKELVEEKTLYVIKMKTGNETIESDQNQSCVMDSPTDDPKSEKSQDETECNVTEADDESSQEEEDENASFSEDNNTTRQGKSKAPSTESVVNDKSMRLRFKIGKFVDVGSQDNSPRKLKFKRGKIVTGADKTSKSGGRRSLKTKGTSFSNDKEQQHKSRSLKVVLKHQDTQKKRGSRVLLFNNVIEETAKQLVETRKSKVKALVGAFESVISLQERNQQQNTYE
ncbi:hypothetical protein EUTSA_v10013405mg [Eutrema salsugineum]|uniref:Calmodulin-binding domain-containing protein n=1 Tax=Eutrema salsugineum TaxID=72664 RepID=V4N7C5_EUTSA|nr:uncharacterized protein LOC18018130 [Eutrema salsugineum]ESQ41516.1 hypothetical protein EUTSA_v10013405mg [Eutrema salsugineum]